MSQNIDHSKKYKKTLITTAITIAAILLLGIVGCSKTPQQQVRPEQLEKDIEEKQKTNGNAQSSDISEDDLQKIIEAAYKEGYAQGYYEGAFTEKINKIMHDDGELYIGIVSEEGEIQYSGISNLMCVCENDSNYYVLKATPDTLVYAAGMINYLDGSTIDHNFDLNNIKAVGFEEYVNERFGEGRLKDCYEAFDKNSSDAFSTYNAVDFEQLEIYNKIVDGRTR